MRAPWLAGGAALVALVSSGAVPAAAQGLHVSVSGLAGVATSGVVVQGVTEQATGTWFGLRLGARLGIVTAEVSGLKGKLAPEAGAAGFSRDGGEMRVAARVSVLPWLAVEGGYTTRAFDSPAGYQKWTIPDLGARLSVALGAPAFRGFVRGAYLPGAGAEGFASPTLGLAVEAGLRYEPEGGGLSFGGFYRLERFDFGTAPGSRLEQFDVLGVSVGLGF